MTGSPRRALILIDVQCEYFTGPLTIQHPPVADALASITVAIDAARAADIPIAVVQHARGEGSPVFDPAQPGYALHPDIESRRTSEWKHVVKNRASVFVGTDLTEWLAQHGVGTVTFAGFMTNNCVLGSAVDSERLGLRAEVLADATGAINIANAAGAADAKTVHTTLLALLNSNWAAVATTAQWVAAVDAGADLPGSNLVASATAADIVPLLG